MGALDGLTILRYGHVYDGGGGMEQYLTDLNRALHDRSDFHTIQMQLTSDHARVGESTRTYGGGEFTRVSLFVEQSSHEAAIAGPKQPRGTLKKVKVRIRDRILTAPGIAPLVINSRLARRGIPVRDGEPKNAGETLRTLNSRHPIDLICLHSAGGADVNEILDVAESSGIPAVYIHHFSNDRLSGISMRCQLARLRGTAGVCGTEIPRFLEGRFRIVADGIDTDFFRRNHPGPVGQKSLAPIMFLPARMTQAKGQATLIRAAGELKRRGLNFQLVLAGRIDSSTYSQELNSLIEQEGLQQCVQFLPQLDPEELRDWYGAASILAFPTTHHEGLPRILIEAQAMEVPPVVFDIGGTAEGVKNGETGYLVKVGDQAGLVARLEELLTDEPERRRMGEAGRRFVQERFCLKSLAERHEDFYKSALGARI